MPSPNINQKIDLSNARIPGLLRRLGAILYDSMLVTAVVFTAFALLYLPLAVGFGLVDINDTGQYKYLFFIYMLMVAVGFHIWFWTHGGQTLGMRTWSMKLFSEDGGKVSLRQALVRYAVAVISLLVFGLGFLWSLFEKEKRSWHDMASGTRLVSVQKQHKH
jgi:uncharacterized RDD family membrane protein YckC